MLTMQSRAAICISLAIFSKLVIASCPTRIVFGYKGKGSWFENLAVRHDGSLLLTSLDDPGNLHMLNPFTRSTPKIVASLPGVNSTLGIVETTKDNFYVIGSNFSLTPTNIGAKQGTNAVFHVDFSVDSSGSQPAVTRLTTLKDAQLLNGLTKFNETLLLAADSVIGGIWAIDTRTGHSLLVAKDHLMAPLPKSAGPFQEGINGIHFWAGDAYFTNSQKRIYGKIPLGPDSYPTAPAQLLAHSLTQDAVKVQWDDFALDTAGNAYIATEQGQGIQMVAPDGKVMVIAGNVNNTALAEPTAAQFGRTSADKHVLYVTTAGGLAYPVYQNGIPVTVGAQVVAVDTNLCMNMLQNK